MSPLQLVLVGTFMEVSIFVFEVPTGVVADTYSRRLSIVIGTAVMGVAVILFGAFATPWPIIAAAALWGFGYTFTSGAFDAWLADEVGPERLAGVYLRGAQVGRVASLAGIGASVGLARRRPAAADRRRRSRGDRARRLLRADDAGDELRAPAAGGAGVVRADAAHGRLTAGASCGPGPRCSRSSASPRSPGCGARATTASGRRTSSATSGCRRSAGSIPSSGSASSAPARSCSRSPSPTRSASASSTRRSQRLATTLFWLDASLLVSALVFGLAGLFWVALVAYFAVGLARNVANPIFQTWLNRNVEESGVRATVLSITNQADAVGQWTGGPAIGLDRERVLDPGRARRRLALHGTGARALPAGRPARGRGHRARGSRRARRLSLGRGETGEAEPSRARPHPGGRLGPSSPPPAR